MPQCERQLLLDEKNGCAGMLETFDDASELTPALVDAQALRYRLQENRPGES